MPPAVYVGPSVPPDLVERLLPEGQIMPPIRRGDLSRDLAIGFRIFLILDGVFFQDLAVSPREIIDVIQGGGVVFGASSMGALRAADCWPAGMHGVGSIYRLFRRGALTSDDEVALTLSPLPPYGAATVPMINVRYAASRLIREGDLARPEADRIVRSASELYFADRTWDLIFEGAGIPDDHGRLTARMASHDLKQLDGVRALERLSRWLREHPRLPRRRRQAASGVPSARREASHESLGTARSGVDRKALWQWLIGTGRYRRYVASVRGRHLAATACLAEHDSAAARAVWAEIDSSGELDAVVLKFVAVTACAEWARSRALVPAARHRHLAQTEIAQAHGYRRWPDLTAELETAAPVGAWITRIAYEVAQAKRGRQDCFAGRLPDGRRLFSR